MGCGASAASVKAAGSPRTLSDTSNVDHVKPVQGATADEIAQGTPVAAPETSPVAAPEVSPAAGLEASSEGMDIEDAARKFRIIEGLSDAAIAIAQANPRAAAGLATAAASLAEELPAAAEGLDPRVASGLAKTASAAADSSSAAAPGLVQAAASSAKDSARVRSNNQCRKVA